MSHKISVCILRAMFLLAVLSTAVLHAQYTTGTVQGTVTDPTGAVVPNGTVILRSLETNGCR